MLNVHARINGSIDVDLNTILSDHEGERRD